jgi:autotransporter-associated beta strand protein
MKPMKPMLAASLLLSALAPLSALAAVNTWTNASGDFKWNNDDLSGEGRNWTLLSLSPFNNTQQPIWVDGNSAVFGATGSGAVLLDTLNIVRNFTVNAAGYSFSGSALTFAGITPTLTTNANFSLGAKLQGSDGLTILGTGVVTLNPAAASTYTGGTRVLGGTVILKAGTSGSNAFPFALHKIEQLDPGATVKYFNELQLSPLDNLRAPNGQLFNKTDMVMTGGTFDLNGDNNQNQMPSPSGFGIITNTSPNARAVLKIGASAGTTREFSGIIQDGGPVVDSPISGNVGFRTDVDMASFEDSAAEIVLSGANTYSGSTRRGGGHLKMKGAGTLGVVTARTPSIGLRINGDNNLPAEVDFNGTSQRVSGMGGNGGKIVNDMVGTTSVLTLGVAPGHLDAGIPSWVGSFRDNSGTGGILAVTKIGTNKQILTGSLHSYSGPTRINDGILEFGSAAAPSPNSDHYITSPGKLSLLYAGSKPIKRLIINGVKLGLGTYDAVSHPGLIEGSGSLQVTVAPTVITISQADGNVTVTWSGGGLLQESTTLANPWTDLPGVTSPYITPIAGPRKFFRVKE